MAAFFYGGQQPHVHPCEPPVAGLRAPGVIFCGGALATARLNSSGRPDLPTSCCLSCPHFFYYLDSSSLVTCPVVSVW